MIAKRDSFVPEASAEKLSHSCFTVFFFLTLEQELIIQIWGNETEIV